MSRLALLIFLCSIIIFSTKTIYSQLAPAYSNEFMSIGVGARALAMGKAVTASTSGLYSGYWNPSGLTSQNNPIEGGLMHSEYFAGIAKYDYLGISAKLPENKTLGVSMIRFGVDDISNTLELYDKDGNIDYDKISTFSVADYGFLFSYASKSKIEGLNYGINFKIIYRRQGDFANAIGFGLDAGLQYQLKGLKLALMGRDITSTFNAWTFNTDDLEEVFEMTGNEIPENGLEITLPKLIAGVAKDFKLNDKFGILAEYNMDLTFDGKKNVLLKSKVINVDPYLGAEVNYSKLVFFRLGFNNIQKITDLGDKNNLSVQPNLGLGVKIKNVEIDYALTNPGNKSFYSNVFSLKIFLNKSFI